MHYGHNMQAPSRDKCQEIYHTNNGARSDVIYQLRKERFLLEILVMLLSIKYTSKNEYSVLTMILQFLFIGNK